MLRSGTILSLRLIMSSFLQLFSLFHRFEKGRLSVIGKRNWHRVQANHLVCLRKSVVQLTDFPDMTTAFTVDVKQ